MQVNIISAYLSHKNEVVAIASSCYYIFNKAFSSEQKGKEMVEKVNKKQIIDDTHWTIAKDGWNL